MLTEEEKKYSEEERLPAKLRVLITKLTMEDLQIQNLEEKYKIIRRISAGTFGQVFKLMRLSDGKNFACKCIPV